MPEPSCSSVLAGVFNLVAQAQELATALLHGIHAKSRFLDGGGDLFVPTGAILLTLT